MTFNRIIKQFLYSKNTDSSTNFVDHYHKKDIYNEIQQFIIHLLILGTCLGGRRGVLGAYLGTHK